LAEVKMVKMCTGAIAMHKFGIIVYRCNSDTSLGPDFACGREQE